MSKVELKYIASLVKTAQDGKTAKNGSTAQIECSNAFAGLFAITFQQQFSLAYSYLWNKGYVLDVLFDVYFTALRSIKRIPRSKTFNQWINDLNRESCEILVSEKDIRPPRGRIHIPELATEDAKRLLEYVFYEEGQDENTIPLETLIEYNQYRERRYGLLRFFNLAIILAVIIAPTSLIKPEFDLSQNHDYFLNGRIRYDITFDSPLPVDTVTATIGNTKTPVYQSGKHTYYVLPTANGKLTVTANFINHQTVKQHATVSGVDRDVPVLVDSKIIDGQIVLYVKDDGSSIDYDRIIALDDAKHVIDPVSCTSIIGEVIFPFRQSALHVYIPDRAGNVLHLVIDGKKS